MKIEPKTPHVGSLTTQPRDQVIIVMAIILLVSLIFLAYELLTARITRALTATVRVTSGLLEDVFPAGVVSRLVQAADRGGTAPPPLPPLLEGATLLDGQSADRLGSAAGLKNSRQSGGTPFAGGGGGSSLEDLSTSGARRSIGGERIADFYPETTILFSDLVRNASFDKCFPAPLAPQRASVSKSRRAN